MKSTELSFIVLIAVLAMPSCVKAQELKKVLKDTSYVATTFADFPVKMCLYTVTENDSLTHQYVCYYDSKHEMRIAYRKRSCKRGADAFTPFLHYGLGSRIDYDSHNYVTMCVDYDGFIHVMGNMHADSLRYWRSDVPWDPSSMKRQVIEGLENKVTYPYFVRSKIDGYLYFFCRTGKSGNGDELVFKYEHGRWKKYSTLFKGQDDNAYILGVAGDADFDTYNPYTGCYEFLYLWRETPDAITCKQLSFAKTKDFKKLYNYSRTAYSYSLRSSDRSFIIDDVPVKGGLLNTVWRMLYSKKGTFIAYHKYDENQNSQIYLIGIYKKKMIGPIKVTDWTGRYEFAGKGSGPAISGGVSFTLGEERYGNKMALWVQCGATFADTKRYYFNEKNLSLLTVDPPQSVNLNSLPSSLKKNKDKKLTRVHLIRDLNDSRFYLRYESLGTNRDKARENSIGVTSGIQVVELK